MPCARCSSEKVFPVEVLAKMAGTTPYRGPVSLVVYGDPSALLFKGEFAVDLRAEVCADCGRVELSVPTEGARQLHDVWSKAQGRGR